MRLPSLPAPVRYWLPPFLWAALIFTVSSMHKVPTPEVPGVPMDKVVHATEYGIFGVLLFRAFHRGAQLTLRGSLVLTACFAALFAASDESHQFFVGRDCEWGDLIADSIGGTLAACVTAFYHSKIATRTETRTS